MQELSNQLSSGNPIIWVALIVVLVLFIKMIKHMSKGFFLLILIFLVIAIVGKFFPEVVAPITEFVRGGWMGTN